MCCLSLFSQSKKAETSGEQVMFILTLDLDKFLQVKKMSSLLLCIYRRLSRSRQLWGLLPVLVLGVPPRYKAK